MRYYRLRRYHYKYESGREGDYLLIGFSPRKSATTIYIIPGFKNLTAQLARLGKHKTSICCLYINKLTDVDMDMLEEIARYTIRDMQARYETWDK